MGRKPREEETKQVIERLQKRIGRLESENVKDLIEMAERGKDIVKLANILRSCGDIIEKSVYDKLIEVVIGFETRCYVTRRTREKGMKPTSTTGAGRDEQ